ncbi:MAG: HlyD family secretion protein [Candidatus Promineifilaceae bacterium]|jgi:HlyD family secretion protein
MNISTKFRFSFLLVILTIVTLGGCGRIGGGQLPVTETPAAEESADAETAAEATTTPLPATGTTILAEGLLVAAKPQQPIGFAINGRLLELFVAAGDQVQAGDLIATLDDEALQDTLTDTALGYRQAENSLAQAQLSLNKLLNWQPDETAVAQAEANLAAAEANLKNAQSQDAASGYSVTSAKVQLEQAQQALADAHEAYDTAFDPGRDWEQYIDDPSCRTGEQFPNCTGAPYSDIIKAERDAAEDYIPRAEDQLRVAEANYNLAIAGLNSSSALGVEANIAAAQQALEQAKTGPKEEDIAAARLQVESAQLALEQAQINQEKAEKAVEDARLLAPAGGIVLSVDSAPGSLVGSGTPVVTLLDTSRLQFQTNNLSERDLAQITTGQEALITLKAYPNDTVDGRVLRVAPVAEGTVGDAATFTVIIDLGESELDLLPGMTGRVEILSVE